MTWTRTSTRVATAATTALLLAGSLAAPAASAAPERRTPPVTITGSNAAFSPNGDGSKDVGVVTYRLAEAGRVTATVRKGSRTVVTRQLGRQAKGTRTFRWNGERAGRVVADGRYTVTIASAGSRARTPLTVDARYGSVRPGTFAAGDLALSSDTVYPRTTVIGDVVVGQYVPGYRGYGPTVDEITWQVLGRGGRVIDSGLLTATSTRVLDRCGDVCGRLEWDGRDRRGDVVPTGTYRVRLVLGRTASGNPALLDAPRPVTVSPKRLVARTTTTTISAASAGGTQPWGWTDFAMSEDDRCEPVPSDARFPGGLSFRSVRKPAASGGFCTANLELTGPQPGRRTPYDSYSVTATGGPTTPGAPDSAHLGAAGEGRAMSGDVTVRVAGKARANTEAPRPDGPPGLSWGVTVDQGQSYDIAGFTYTLTQYVPAG